MMESGSRLSMLARQQRAEIAQISAGLCCRTKVPDHPVQD